MKKTLMALSLAMCATAVFAQARIQRSLDGPTVQTHVSAADFKNQPVDYKASIFTKAGDIDTVQLFKFNTAPAATTYGSSCALSATDVIDDTAAGSTAHTLTAPHTYWRYYSDTTDFNTKSGNELPGFVDLFEGYYFDYVKYVMGDSLTNDGFMFLDMTSQQAATGNFNCYFTLPVVANSNTTTGMFEVRLTQWYAKFYDNCYIDYKIGNNWYSREINVNGIDLETNELAARRVAFTMPVALATQANVELRVRVYTTRFTSTPGSYRAAYGYAWAIDEIALVRRMETERWSVVNTNAIDGFYGTIPQAAPIPITYGVTLNNQVRGNIANTKVTISASTNRDGAFTEVASSPAQTLIGGDIDSVYTLVVNERGFYNADWSTSLYAQYPMVSPNYGATTLPAPYTNAKSLPTTQAGANYYAVAISGGSRNIGYDTVFYNVSTYFEPIAGTEDSRTVAGYRWAHDNGIIPGGSIFAPQYVSQEGSWYFTPNVSNSDNHHTMPGYQMHVRYTTGSELPANWCLRGLEIVPTTTVEARDMAGVVISLIVAEDTYDSEDGSWGWSYDSVVTGVENRNFTITESMANPITGRILPNEDYSAFNVAFPEQPKLKPNTSYRFGYILQQNGNFAPASVAYRYTTDSNTTTYYSQDPQTANMVIQQVPTDQFDVLVYDYEASRWAYGHWQADMYPMIRPIVGTYEEPEHSHMSLQCDANQTAVYRINSYRADSVCDHESEVAEGSLRVIYVTANDPHRVITKIFFNGTELEVSDDNSTANVTLDEYDDNVMSADSSTVLLYRKFYAIAINGADPSVNYTFSYETEYRDYVVGIDPFAPEAYLTLSPNPATSSVKLNINGVTGKVNCSIIDMSGRVVYNADMNAEEENVINVNAIPAGAYFVRVTNDSFSKIEKLIIK